MNPEGFVKQEPMPEWIAATGRFMVGVVKGTTGWDIPVFEGVMLVVSSLVMFLAIIVWIIIDRGNERDKQAEESGMLPHGTRSGLSSLHREIRELARDPGRDSLRSSSSMSGAAVLNEKVAGPAATTSTLTRRNVSLINSQQHASSTPGL
mmetsp:Transcript_26330/g.57444  ORF Transcript_26330/g.57444 Transcript_26330/m.57444 type:complete len:150 (+) Transcript_26330:212-661(+)|eukprot:CAMPEP_0202897166 /NCGR_PEP_ID=MMETSP1392-20130828/6003_1 /ASSEMBLY_ACC=CAM_ASM_000868 /TAXON_ID=225041 /ORGANISM="Chlamydomonas chlamydogama, Strain SAG 11-48b" /LENGTH=149 /DNA_ID=CAMNT_0049582739 /DNA_START=211 /DNA_END=660 /DNA_ORIENTATION=-